jgi:large subunit ribosomal protein L25
MADIAELKAEKRETGGKGAARALRREGRVPAVIYGGGEAPLSIHLDYVEVLKAVNTGQFLATLHIVDVNGAGKARVIPKDVQFDPVRDFPMHVDFLRVAKDARISVEVTVNFIGEDESPGLKRGGALNVVRHNIEISAPADAIPEAIDADLSELDIGDSLHASSLKLPKGVELTITDRNFTIVSIAGKTAEEPERGEEEEAEAAAGGEEAAEGEGEKKGEE